MRNLLIRKEIQLTFVLLNLLFMAVAASVIILVILPPIYESFQSSANAPAQNALAKLFILIMDRLIVALGAILVLSVIYTLIVTHRFCGPLENFCKTFQKISQGDLSRKVFLRRNDFLKYEAKQVNDMIDSLCLRLDTIKQQHQTIKSKVEELSVPEPQDTNARRIFSELASAVDECEKTFGEVKILVRDTSFQ